MTSKENLCNKNRLDRFEAVRVKEWPYFDQIAADKIILILNF